MQRTLVAACVVLSLALCAVGEPCLADTPTSATTFAGELKTGDWILLTEHHIQWNLEIAKPVAGRKLAEYVREQKEKFGDLRTAHARRNELAPRAAEEWQDARAFRGDVQFFVPPAVVGRNDPFRARAVQIDINGKPQVVFPAAQPAQPIVAAAPVVPDEPLPVPAPDVNFGDAAPDVDVDIEVNEVDVNAPAVGKATKAEVAALDQYIKKLQSELQKSFPGGEQPLFEVTTVGSDFVKLSNGETTWSIPFHSIRGISKKWK